MPVGDVVSQRFGVGGFDVSKPNNNVVEQAVVVAETATVQTIEVRSGSGAVLSTFTRVRDISAENAGTLVTRAQAALTANATFLALASPTNAQTLAQVQRLTKENNALIRLALGLLSDISDTA